MNTIYTSYLILHATSFTKTEFLRKDLVLFSVFKSIYVEHFFFQVFVFSPKVYLKLQETFQQYRESSGDFKRVLQFFSPLRSEYIGHIFSSSGDRHLEYWAHLNLLSFLPGFPAFPYSSLLNLHSDPYLLEELTDAFEDNAVLKADFTSLANFFPEEKRLWFKEVLNNQIQMWENNF